MNYFILITSLGSYYRATPLRQHFDNRAHTLPESKSPSEKGKVTVLGDREKNVLVLGAGMVASSLAEYLGRSKSTTVIPFL